MASGEASLAQDAGQHGQIEAGRATGSVATLKKLAAAMNIKIDDLV